MLSATRPVRTVTTLLLGALALAAGGPAPASAALLDPAAPPQPRGGVDAQAVVEVEAEAGVGVGVGVGSAPGGGPGDGPSLPPPAVVSRSTLTPVVRVAPGCASAVVVLPVVGPVTWFVVTGATTRAASLDEPVDPRATTRFRAELSQRAVFTDGTTRTDWVVAPAGGDLRTGCSPVPPPVAPAPAGPPISPAPSAAVPAPAPTVPAAKSPTVPPATAPTVPAGAPAVTGGTGGHPGSPTAARDPRPAADRPTTDRAVADRPATDGAPLARAGDVRVAPVPAAPSTTGTTQGRADEPEPVEVGGGPDPVAAASGTPDGQADRGVDEPSPGATVALSTTASGGDASAGALVTVLVLLLASAGVTRQLLRRSDAATTAAGPQRH